MTTETSSSESREAAREAAEAKPTQSETPDRPRPAPRRWPARARVWLGGVDREARGSAEFLLARQCFWSGMQLLESGRYGGAMLLLTDAWRWVDVASRRADPTLSEPGASDIQPRELSTLLTNLAQGTRVAANSEAVNEVVQHRELLADPHRRRLLELERRDARALASALATVVAGEISPMERRLVVPPGRAITWTKRGLLVAAVLVLGVWLLGPKLRDLLRGPNLALGATAYASHTDPAFDIPPSRVVDGDRENLGFNTGNQHVPRLEIDLGAVKRIKQIIVYNRVDCCEDSAIPLMVEVGAERERYHEVATRQEPFDVWSVDVPGVEARWLRLTVVRSSTFHLAEVEVY